MNLGRRHAVRFVVLLGVVSLLADVTYEGARSLSGPYLATLGASAAVVAMVAGFGELIGYGLRLMSGILADRTRRYWTITLVGYAINLGAVPLLALATRWEYAAVLLALERTGKAIRAPARDVMLSQATSMVGRGWGFGLHEAMDQIGALSGPLLVAAVLAWTGGYRGAFAMLAIPAFLALLALTVAQRTFPHPAEFERRSGESSKAAFPPEFRRYLIAAMLMAAGFADFPLLAFHAKKTAMVSDALIPVAYSIAMGVDAVAALVFGRWFDRAGIPVLGAGALFAGVAVPLVLFGNPLVGIVCWGIGMGAQESVLRSAVAQLAPPDRRGAAYGLFHTCFGIAWFAGSAAMGFIYSWSLYAMAGFALAAQLAAALTFVSLRRP